VINEIPDSAPMALLAIKLLAQYTARRVPGVRRARGPTPAPGSTRGTELKACTAARHRLHPTAAPHT
jgi:hypothetical protein